MYNKEETLSLFPASNSIVIYDAIEKRSQCNFNTQNNNIFK